MNRTSTALPSASYQANVRKVTLLALLVLLAAVFYMVVAVNFGNQQLMLYSMKIRTPKLVVMLITAFAIGGASIVFQSIINNTIVTPCLLGMNSLYTLIHTAVVFFAGSGSLLARNANLSFAADVILMGIVATIIYSYLFQKRTTMYSMSCSSAPCSPPFLQHPDHADPGDGSQRVRQPALHPGGGL